MPSARNRGVETLQRLSREKEVGHEGEGVLDLWRTSKPIIGGHNFSTIQSAEFNQGG